MFNCRALLVLVVVGLSGCATATLDPQTKATVRSVFVESPQLPSSPTVVPAEGSAMAVVSGKSSPAPQEAATRLRDIVDSRVGLAKVITDRASQELQSRGYRVVPSPSGADATLRFVVYHGLGVAGATSNDRGISMTVNMELSRTADGKRLLFSIANQISNPDARARVRFAPYAAWFSDESLTVEQYRLVAESLVAQSLQGM